MRDYKYSVWLNNIFIRHIIVTEGSVYEAEKAIHRNLIYLYPVKHTLLDIKLEK